MKKLSTLFLVFLLSFSAVTPALATSGACSDHDGVDCGASSYAGSVVCNDGWMNSSVSYSDINECSDSNLPPCPVPFTQADLDSAKASSATANSNLNTIESNYKTANAEILNGTYPLTASQQAQVDSSNTQFNAVLQAQAQANKSYQGGVALAGNRLGTNINNPQEYQSEQQQASSQGQQNISNLQNQQNLTIAQMTEGFMDSDYKILTDQYNADEQVAMQKWTYYTALAGCPVTVSVQSPVVPVPVQVTSTQAVVAPVTPVSHVESSVPDTAPSTAFNNGAPLTSQQIETIKTGAGLNVAPPPAQKVTFWTHVHNFFAKLKFW